MVRFVNNFLHKDLICQKYPCFLHWQHLLFKHWAFQLLFRNLFEGFLVFCITIYLQEYLCHYLLRICTVCIYFLVLLPFISHLSIRIVCLFSIRLFFNLSVCFLFVFYLDFRSILSNLSQRSLVGRLLPLCFRCIHIF